MNYATKAYLEMRRLKKHRERNQLSTMERLELYRSLETQNPSAGVECGGVEPVRTADASIGRDDAPFPL